MFTKKIKNLRQSKGLTQAEMADKIDVARTTYAMYEQGKREPDFEILKRLAYFFNVTTDYLLDNSTRHEAVINNELPSSKAEKDIAKQLEEFRDSIENSDGLAFDGEPMSEEAKESLIESMEHIFRQTQRINKKYAPKKYKDKE